MPPKICFTKSIGPGLVFGILLYLQLRINLIICNCRIKEANLLDVDRHANVYGTIEKSLCNWCIPKLTFNSPNDIRNFQQNSLFIFKSLNLDFNIFLGYYLYTFLCFTYLCIIYIGVFMGMS